MRLVVYGFGPYLDFRDNITKKIIKKLRARTGLKKVVFPVRFQRKQFIQAIRKHKPDVVLGLGQCSNGRTLRIELRAVNRRRGPRQRRAAPIESRGSKALPTTLKLGRYPGTSLSRDAGHYVCNFSMYVMLSRIRTKKIPARFGFAHIPWNYDLNRAARIVEKLLDRATAASIQKRIHRGGAEDAEEELFFVKDTPTSANSASLR
jgi:pyrrolidone-carboxylate peptidase